MNITTIPLKNMRRKPVRTLLLLLVFTLGVLSVVALYQVSLVIGHNLEKQLSSYGANIVVSPQVQTLKVSYGDFNLGNMYFDVSDLQEKDVVHAIKNIGYSDRIAVVAPKLVAMTKVTEIPVAVVGVDWQMEQALKSYWAVDGSYPEEAYQVVIGAVAAKSLSLQSGDKLDLFGEQFTVAGVLYETGSDDDTVILMNLKTLQQVQNKENAASFIEVAALCAGCPIDDIVSQIRTALPGNVEVKALQNVVDQRMASIKFVQHLALIVSIIILITGASMIGLSMLSTVNERKKDIGILRSLGFGKSRVFFVFCFEAGLLGATAGFAGYILGWFTSTKILGLLSIADGIIADFSILHLGLTGLLFCLIAFLAALYPAWKGASIEPSGALVAL